LSQNIGKELQLHADNISKECRSHRTIWQCRPWCSSSSKQFGSVQCSSAVLPFIRKFKTTSHI